MHLIGWNVKKKFTRDSLCSCSRGGIGSKLVFYKGQLDGTDAERADPKTLNSLLVCVGT